MNYEIPKPPRKLNPRAIHLYDIIAFVFILLVALPGCYHGRYNDI